MHIFGEIVYSNVIRQQQSNEGGILVERGVMKVGEGMEGRDEERMVHTRKRMRAVCSARSTQCVHSFCVSGIG